jgi:hypothetical protein
MKLTRIVFTAFLGVLMPALPLLAVFGLLWFAPVAFAQGDGTPGSWAEVFTPDIVTVLASTLSGLVIYLLVNILKLSSAVTGNITRFFNAVLNLLFSQIILAAFGLGVFNGGGILRAFVAALVAFLISWGAALGQRQAVASALEKRG